MHQPANQTMCNVTPIICELVLLDGMGGALEREIVVHEIDQQGDAIVHRAAFNAM